MTAPVPRYCITCKHSVSHAMLPAERGVRLCCDQAKVAIGQDASFCGEMRRGACGPDGTLWEAK